MNRIFVFNPWIVWCAYFGSFFSPVIFRRTEFLRLHKCYNCQCYETLRTLTVAKNEYPENKKKFFSFIKHPHTTNWRNYTANVDPKSCSSQFKPLGEKETQSAYYIIFDMDGVILDSHKFEIEAHEKYLIKFKKAMKQSLKNKILGLPHRKAAQIIVEELDLSISPQTYTHGIWQYLRELYPTSKKITGIERFVCHFNRHGIQTALVSGYDEKCFNLKTKKHKKYINMFCPLLLGDDSRVKRPKPHPDIYLTAARLFHKPSNDMAKYLVVTDCKNSLRAAKEAGMQVLLYPARITEEKVLKEANSVILNFERWDPTEFDLPKLTYY